MKLNKTTPYLYNSEFKPGISYLYYSGPYWDNKEIDAAIDSLMNGKWLSSGEKINKFEKLFSKKFNTKDSLMVNSGSSANLVMISALKKYYNWLDGDEIIVSPVGFPTTVSVIIQNNLKPIFIDIEWNTLNFDVDKIEDFITKKTKAIFVSPVLGNPPDIDKLIEISKKNNLLLIGDNCDSLGSKWDDKYINEYYTIFSNSFYPAHHISTGEGGMVSSNNLELIKIARSISWWGRDCYCVGSGNLTKCGTCNKRFDNWIEEYNGVLDHKYVFTNVGYNLKPLDLQGAIGIIQLDKFNEISEKRKKSKTTIENIFLTKIPKIKTIKTLDKSDVCWFGTPFVCENKEDKLKLVNYLEDNKIQTRNYFAGNILIHPAYSHLDDYKKYPEANEVLDKVFFVGASPHYNEEHFDYIEKILTNYV